MDPKLAPLFQEYPQTPEEAALRTWLESNKATFLSQNWTPAEVAHMAMNVGFDTVAIYSILSHGQNAIDGVRCENKAALQFFLFEEACETFSKLQNKDIINLEDSWKAYVSYVIEGNEFKEVA
jgi:hypothetical protein